MQTVINKWKEKLLDTGKGNNLINYKFSNSKNLEIVYPNVENVLNMVTANKVINFFDIDKVFAEYENEYSISNKEKLNLLKSSIENKSVKLKKDSVIAFNNNNPTTTSLNKLYKTNHDFLQEKGINILYLAYIFLKWEDTNEKQTFFSPVLLFPLGMEKDKLNKSYVISQYEDEIITNPTLLYKLKNEFNLTLPEFRDENFPEEPLPDYINRLVTFANENEWQLEERCFISCFSFLKINMYKDLEDNEEAVISNPLIKRLANKSDEYNLPISTPLEKNLELTLHNVVDADSSQMEAIAKAMRGESFVLQGPPGTGKSQTITNLIAEYLYNNKKVLFVSEKIAALKVVYKNLSKVGLENFCLELHSNKTNKKEVVANLYKELSSEKINVKPEAEKHIEKLISSKQKLDNFASAIHSNIENINMSAFEIFNILSDLSDTPLVDFIIGNIETKTQNDLNNTLALIKEYIIFSESIGYDYKKNNFFGFNILNLNYSEKLELKKTLNTSLEKYNNLNNFIKLINDLLQINLCSLNNIEQNLPLIKFISNMKYFDGNFMIKNKLTLIYSLIQEINKLKEFINNEKKIVLQKYNNDIFSLNILELFLNYKNNYSSAFRIFNSSFRKDNNLIKACGLNNKADYSYITILNDLQKCKIILDTEKTLELKSTELFNNLLNKNNIILTNSNQVEIELAELNNLLTNDFNSLLNFNIAEFNTLQEKLKTAINSFDLNNSQITLLQNYFNPEIFNLKTFAIENIIEKITYALNNYDLIDNYIKFNNLMENLKINNLLYFIDLLIKDNYIINDFAKIYEKTFYTQYIYNYISNNESLNEFTEEKINASVNTFIKEDKINFEISKAKIIKKMCDYRPSTTTLSNHGQVAILAREAHKKSHLKPVHKLLAEISELVQILKPCFLMSPLSVSTYLQNNACNFDVVIFDEASQIFPWDAIGAIYRANQVIIVGDPKQMPPTNFFNANTFNDELEVTDENSDTLDFESILDLALSTFDNISLKWHYRSKTEELIAFSNKHFYDGNLVTFPTANNTDDLGVSFVYVENGVYNRKTNENEIEAEKVVDLIFEHFKNYPNRSLGVVAFSISQQTKIEELLNKRRTENKKFEKFFDPSLEDAFFIKNLETVQGDERDTIIFSVAYGKDEKGKFIHNFGPLNKQGGERRLNVAITRAKYNIKLVASITSQDIDTTKTDMRGSLLLKEYLSYAESNGQNIQIVYDKDLSSNAIQNEVKLFIESNGYVVDNNLGFSSFKIPLAIKIPNSEKYYMAIDFDTNSLQKTTRERERLRKENCERMGWKYYKIWAQDWILNKKMCQNKLLKILQKALEVSEQPQEQLPVPSFIEKASKPDTSQDNSYLDLFKRYEYFNATEYCTKNNKALTFDNIIEPLIQQEQPITEKFLLKRITQIFPGEKITDNFRYGFFCAINEHKNILRHNDFYCLNKNISTELRMPDSLNPRREIEDISLYELSSGLYKIIEQCVGIDKLGLYKTIVKLLGYFSLSSKMENFLNTALQILLDNKTIYLEDNQYFV